MLPATSAGLERRDVNILFCPDSFTVNALKYLKAIFRRPGFWCSLRERLSLVHLLPPKYTEYCGGNDSRDSALQLDNLLDAGRAPDVHKDSGWKGR